MQMLQKRPELLSALGPREQRAVLTNTIKEPVTG